MRLLTAREVSGFQKTIWEHYKQHGRKLPWRFVADPYKILVSEMMLQQTQVSRVLQKYPLFIQRFPTVSVLAKASFHDVFFLWSGLGYNRRAKFLHEATKIIFKKYEGEIPCDVHTLASLPGIGAGTAGAILAFAFNKSSPFIETNIRSTFIYHFFFRRCLKTNTKHSHILKNVRVLLRQKKVRDEEILPLVEQTLDKENPREWYYALMDYGVMLKEKHQNPSRRSAHYMKQSFFKNSKRQVRGEILKILLQYGTLTKTELLKYIKGNKKYIKSALFELQKEKFIYIQNNYIYLQK